MASTMASGDTDRDRPRQDAGEGLRFRPAARVERPDGGGVQQRADTRDDHDDEQEPVEGARSRAQGARNRHEDDEEEGAGEEPPGPADATIRRVRGSRAAG